MINFIYIHLLITFFVFISGFCCITRIQNFESNNDVPNKIIEDDKVEILYSDLLLIFIPIVNLMFLFTFIIISLASDETISELYKSYEEEINKQKDED